MTDQEGSAPDYDPELWVILEGDESRCYLLGNAHTWPGRMVVWGEEIGRTFAASTYQVTDASDAARRWMDGFLHGNEPTPGEYLGIGEFAASNLDDDDPAFPRWRAALQDFHVNGTLPALQSVPTTPFPRDEIYGHIPWAWAGGQVWTWKDRAWQVADPQPALDGTLLVGSICAERGYSNMEAIGDNHLACVDCGETVEAYDVPLDELTEEVGNE